MKKQDKNKFWLRVMCWILAVVMIGGAGTYLIMMLINLISG